MVMTPQPQTDTTTTAAAWSSATPFVHSLKWIIISLFFILILIICIAWFILNPREPGFLVTSLSVSDFSASTASSQLRGMYQIHLNITNPNKKINVRVENFNLFVCYGKVQIPVPNAKVQQPIYVNKMSEKATIVELSLIKDTAPSIIKGVVKLNVKMNVRVSFEYGSWPTKEKFFEVYCDVGFVLVKDTAKLLDNNGKPCIVTSY